MPGGLECPPEPAGERAVPPGDSGADRWPLGAAMMTVPGRAGAPL